MIKIVSWGDEGISTYHIAVDLKTRLEARGYEAEITESYSKLNGEHVINLRETKTPRILDNVRFNRPKSVCVVHVNNVEQTDNREWGRMMLSFEKSKMRGVPMHMVSHSPYAFSAIKKRLTTIFSPAMCRSIMENVSFCRYGIEEVFQPGEHNDRNRFIVPFVHFLQAHKNFSLHSKVSSEVKKYVLVRHQQETVHAFKKREAFEVPDAQKHLLEPYTIEPVLGSREEYVKSLQTFGMAVATSNFESLGLYFLEALASGVVVCFIDKPWVRTLLPDYNFVAPEDQLTGLVCQVWERYDEARKYVLENTVPYIRRMYSIDRFVDYLLLKMPGVESERQG